MSNVLPLPPILLQVGDWAELAALAGPVCHAVFVREQGIAEDLEWDSMDPACVHCVAFAGDLPVGTGRLLPDAHIGRMAVLADWRRHRVGAMILDRLIDVGRARGEEQRDGGEQRDCGEQPPHSLNPPLASMFCAVTQRASGEATA